MCAKDGLDGNSFVPSCICSSQQKQFGIGWDWMEVPGKQPASGSRGCRDRAGVGRPQHHLGDASGKRGHTKLASPGETQGCWGWGLLSHGAAARAGGMEGGPVVGTLEHCVPFQPTVPSECWSFPVPLEQRPAAPAWLQVERAAFESAFLRHCSLPAPFAVQGWWVTT